MTLNTFLTGDLPVTLEVNELIYSYLFFKGIY